MKMMKRLLIVARLLAALQLHAQDPFFTQQNYGWAMINPAYAGSLKAGRVESGYRLQWPALASSYQTFNLAYDQHFRCGGVGFNYTYDNAGNVLKTNRFDFNYAYGFKFGRSNDSVPKVIVQPGVQFSYYNKSVDWAQLTMGDQIDPRRGFVYSTTETSSVNTRHQFDVSAGLLVVTKRILAGLSTYHLTEPNEGFVGNSKLPRRFVIHAAGIIGNADDEDKSLRIVPSVLYMQQQDAEMLVGMVTAKLNGISLGIGYRSQDALLFTAGYLWNDIAVGYSCDLTISSLKNTGGSHEIHCAWRFMKDKWNAERNARAFF